ncbi:hypothetical protein EJ06DRAFT_315244 [Trichodelitschia bisporula]|uniref:N-alpha-acetyltransferase 40 n=1 Tax=Trichodelitschia bisporula TaxID=703511 RepID=A0A6G1I4G4_9PEZI|nr:hypothetical protein EJ06DRAFT_315244 [Trichodelitschia bisporula]
MAGAKRKMAVKPHTQEEFALAMAKLREDGEASSKRARPATEPTEAQMLAHLAPLNALPPPSFLRTYAPYPLSPYTTKRGITYGLSFTPFASLTPAEHTACLSLIEYTSAAHYRASRLGWNPTAKSEEMREPDLRYILVRRSDTDAASDTPAASPGGSGSERDSPVPDTAAEAEAGIVGFMSMMLTIEAEQLVLYIYELHLREEARGTGLAGHLMGWARGVGKATGMSKCMLTVYTANARAEAFYRRLGYVEDAISPKVKSLRGGRGVRPEYLIMSLVLEG